MREFVGRPLASLGAAAFVVGTLYMLLEPPSFSGLPGLAIILGWAAGLILVAAWITVVLAGPRALSEEEFERVVERTEVLAARPPMTEEGGEFEALVAAAIDRLPDEFRRLLETTPVVVSHRGGREGAYGHYFGDTVAREYREDRIVLYRDTLERDFGHDPDLLAAQVERTLRHEVAHHLGWNEEGVRSLGL
jgi:predicted Zn-dependent protease with MMP-like domain